MPSIYFEIALIYIRYYYSRNSSHAMCIQTLYFILVSLLATTNDSIVVYQMTLLSKLVKVSWKANVGICCYKFQTSICIVQHSYIQTEVYSMKYKEEYLYRDIPWRKS